MPAQLTNQFTPTDKQREALQALAAPTPNVLFYGSSRSGKSIAICYYLIQVALSAPKTRIGIFRRTAVACKSTLFDLSFPETMDLIFPGLWSKMASDKGSEFGKVNRSDMTVEFSNGSKILFGGMDDTDRVEKILGQSIHTIWLNEATDIAYASYSSLITRLSGKATTKSGKEIPQKIIADCNPKSKRHWLYKQFIAKVNPTSNIPVVDPDDFAWMKLHTADNLANLPATYLKNLQNLSPADQKRFLHGEWTDAVDGALFTQEDIDKYRLDRTILAGANDLRRIVVAVDPAVSSNEGSDETGIIVAGLDDAGHGYVLEDLTIKGSPERWAGVAVAAYHRWKADAVVAEVNQGGAMVESVIRQHDRNVSYKAVHASRGKVIRAEPVSALYSKGLIHHPANGLPDLEDQMIRFNLSYNRSRDGSPDRLDAMVWAITELMVEESDERTGRYTPMQAGGFWR